MPVTRRLAEVIWYVLIENRRYEVRPLQARVGRKEKQMSPAALIQS